jgi:hypothetical protein
VRLIEREFGEQAQPEKHLHLLRDLRLRAQELQAALEEDMSAEKSRSMAEKEALQRTARDAKQQLEELRVQHDATIHALRERYETSLRQAQEALEIQTSAARVSNDRRNHTWDNHHTSD